MAVRLITSFESYFLLFRFFTLIVFLFQSTSLVIITCKTFDHCEGSRLFISIITQLIGYVMICFELLIWGPVCAMGLIFWLAAWRR